MGFIVLKTQKYICENCEAEVVGGRYNNHCPKCLWSKHLDDQKPGDRASQCRGLMEPIGIEKKGEKWRIKHQCQKCGKRMVVDVSKNDNLVKIEELLRLSTGR